MLWITLKNTHSSFCFTVALGGYLLSLKIILNSSLNEKFSTDSLILCVPHGDISSASTVSGIMQICSGTITLTQFTNRKSKDS